MNTITFTKVALPYGWLGNMAPFPVWHEGKSWLTSEALFQALRFSDESIRELIRSQKSPMGAKMKAKANKAAMVIKPCSPEDLENMRLMLRLKVEQHPKVKADLLATRDATIIEDCTARKASPWGARLVDGQWVGENILGRMWMELRDSLRATQG